MITIKIMGGLGNQMFQYSIGKCLAHKKRTGLSLDISDYESYKLHGFSLANFDVKLNYISKYKRYCYLPNKYINFWPKKYLIEKSAIFQPNALEQKSDDLFLVGYWQSEEYFSEIKEEIKRTFTNFSVDLSKETVGYAKMEQTCNSISIHVRRGDYVSDPNAQKTHGSCTLEYYNKAIRSITKKVSNPTFFIFSDDPDWARKKLKLDFPCYFINHNGSEKNYEDIYLMSQCKHHIIANSTFSWWGAWLGEEKDSIIIGPQVWFVAEAMKNINIMPERWKKI